MARAPGISLRGPAIACAVIAALLSAAQPAAGEDRMCLDNAPVCIVAEPTEAGLSFVVSNRTAAPYSVRVTLPEHENLKPIGTLPFRAVVHPGADQVVGSADTIDPEEPIYYDYAWGAAPGSLLARPDTSWQYRMPFGGKDLRSVSHGFGEGETHKGYERYATDFAMPWGTPILVARNGTVVEVVDRSIANGRRMIRPDQANRVSVLHVDGTIATYAYLRHGIALSEGDRVSTGGPIGYSGEVGITGEPRLHFMVWTRRLDLSRASVPVRFHDGSALGVKPQRGVAYAPACSITGEGCELGEVPRSPGQPRPFNRTGYLDRGRGYALCAFPARIACHHRLRPSRASGTERRHREKL